MSETETEFAELANAFITMANERLTSTNHTQVAMALLAASARFNAYIVTAACGTPETARLEAPKASAFLVDHFKQSLTTNLDDYINNHEMYADTSGSKN
ncbi:MAG: DUF3144 domain-containing protein [Pseudomonadota bacterium]|nr:DUF3144 domain-containing protein [Pseudomonadota bacterium]MDQ3159695.1 DUF3144 domain-containing protein [Pseudomonadota bacterium]